MSLSQLCTDVKSPMGHCVHNISVKTAKGTTATIDVYEEEKTHGEKRYIYVSNGLIVGAGAWRQYPKGSRPSNFLGSTEIVQGRNASLFWLGGGWVVAYGIDLTTAATALQEIGVDDLGLDTRKCYAVVKQNAGTYGVICFQNSTTFIIGGWKWTCDGLIAESINLPSVARPKIYSKDEAKAAAESLNSVTPDSCVGMVYWTKDGGIAVENSQIAYLRSLNSKSSKSLTRQILSQRGELYLHSRTQARRYTQYVHAAWTAYMNAYVRKTGQKMDKTLHAITKRLHKAYLQRIGLQNSATTKASVHRLLSQLPVEVVVKYIRLWEIQGLKP